MSRFSKRFDAAAVTLNFYYKARAECNLDSLIDLWVDEEFACWVDENGIQHYGIENIRNGLNNQIRKNGPVTITALDIHAYNSLSTVIYAIVETHANEHGEKMVFSTYVLVLERSEWRIAHLHVSIMPPEAANIFLEKLRHARGPLH